MPGAVKTLEIPFAGHTLRLLPDRAIFWPVCRTLIIADVHLGKAAAFRVAGIPVPTGASAKDLSRVSALIADTDARRVIVLGDLVHAARSHQPELFDLVSRWRAMHADLDILLVRGNHDKSAGPTPREWRISEVEEGVDELGIILSHHPPEGPCRSVIYGHIHPMARLRDFDGSSVNVPAFIFDGDSMAVLPSFGCFTGGKHARLSVSQRTFVTIGNRVIEIT
jgi:hypothetical protein